MDEKIEENLTDLFYLPITAIRYSIRITTRNKILEQMKDDKL